MARPKGQPKLGGRKKGTPNKMTLAEKEVGGLLAEDRALTKLLAWIKKLWDKYDKGTITENEERLLSELLKAALPYTNRKMPVAAEIEHSGSISIADQIKAQFYE